MTAKIIIRKLGLQPYSKIWQAMKEFTQNRVADTVDELWLVEHPPVFTQGQAGKTEHILNSHQIPVMQTDRGGQVTYHGPGQMVAYPLLNLALRNLNIRRLVSTLELCVIDVLSELDIKAQARIDAPGVYVHQSKICSIGLRVRRGCCYHGIALNVAMDLTPFSYINPCGFSNLQMTQIAYFKPEQTCESIIPLFTAAFLRHFGYTENILVESSHDI